MKPFKIAIAGHVDHGKSTLIGKILQETGHVFEDRQKKVENICQKKGIKFEYAFLLDAFEEEQKQGITIDKLDIPWNYKNKNYIFIDTPGHKEFLKNMVSGSSNADCALIMIDAQEGIRAQTKQHLAIIDLLRVPHVVIAINKMDLVNYNEAVYDSIKNQIEDVLKNYNFISTAIIPISAYEGENIFARSSQMKWFKDNPLIKTIEAFPESMESINAPLRLSIQDIYKFDNLRIYAGIVLSGKIQQGDSISFALSEAKSKIESFQEWNVDPKTLEEKIYTAGDVVSFTLSDPLFLPKGDIGYKDDNRPVTSKNIEASVFWFSSNKPQKNKFYDLKISNQKQKIKITNINEEENSIYRLNMTAEAPIAFDDFESIASLKRFVLLDQFQIACAGIINANQALTNDEAIIDEKNPIIWLTGLSGAGKSTLALELKTMLEENFKKVIILDGDELRSGLNSDLGFDLNSRFEQARRTAELAKILNKQGFTVIVSLISPQQSARSKAREILKDQLFIETFIDTSYEECAKRDPKGLYKMARAGDLSQFTGKDSVYEKPLRPEIHIDNNLFTANENAQKIMAYIKGPSK